VNTMVPARGQSGVGFAVEVDTIIEDQWSVMAQQFADANICQTWAYGVARSGLSNVSHLVLKRGIGVVGAVQARLAGLPALRLGLAYIRWGPLWKLRTGQEDAEVFRQMVRAIRNEYAIRRGLAVRLLPHLCDEEDAPHRKILEEEGYEPTRKRQPYRTILMDIRAPLDELERGLHPKWRKHLSRARKNNLEIVEGEEDSLFEALGAVYREMVQRKQFVSDADIRPYITTQQTLAPAEKMRVVLCKADGEVVAGALFSPLGDTAVDLFRATSNRGITTHGSYLVQWRVIEYLKQHGCLWYNLNGINPTKNPGGYQFKSQLAGKNGRDVRFLGPFDAYPNAALRLLMAAGEKLRASLRRRAESVSPTPARKEIAPRARQNDRMRGSRNCHDGTPPGSFRTQSGHAAE
jgi:hypothetical protein